MIPSHAVRRIGLGLIAVFLASGPIAGCDGSSQAILGPGGSVRLLAFASDATGQFDLLVFDLSSISYRQIAGLNDAAADDLHPGLDREGKRLVFQSDRAGGAGGSDLYAYDLEAGQYISLAALNTAGEETEPAFSGNGRRVALVRDTLGFRRIRLFDPDSARYVPLVGLETRTGFNDWAPAPNADGTIIAFATDSSGSVGISVWYAGPPARILSPIELRSDSVDTEPTMTPDGRYLCFASNRAGGAGGYDLYLFDLQMMGLVGLKPSANSAADERNPSISEGATVISFESNRPGGLGEKDVWNHNRLTGQTGQGAGQSSPMNEIQPSLVWR